MTGNGVISARRLVKDYQRGSERVRALKEASFDIREGEFVAIVGPSGSGKTTLLNLIGCLDTPTCGSLLVGGQEVSRLKERELVRVRRANIGFIFQQFFLLPTLTVEENIGLPLFFAHGRRHYQDHIKGILKAVGLEDRARHRPHQLSGGEMQRVAIGRAMVRSPRLILADEPTGNLDSETAQRIYELFQRLNQGGLTLVVVTHNLELARLAHRVICLRDGQIVEA